MKQTCSMKATTSAALTLSSFVELFARLATGPDFPRPLLDGTSDFRFRSSGTPARLRRQAQRLRQLIHRTCRIAMGFGEPRSAFAIRKAVSPHLAQLLLEPF